MLGLIVRRALQYAVFEVTDVEVLRCMLDLPIEPPWQASSVRVLPSSPPSRLSTIIHPVIPPSATTIRNPSPLRYPEPRSQPNTHTSVVGVPPSRSSQVETDGESESRCKDGGNVDRVSLEECVVDDLSMKQGVQYRDFSHRVGSKEMWPS